MIMKRTLVTIFLSAMLATPAVAGFDQAVAVHDRED